MDFFDTIKQSAVSFQQRIGLELDVINAASTYRHNPTDETYNALMQAIDTLEAFEAIHGGRRKR